MEMEQEAEMGQGWGKKGVKVGETDGGRAEGGRWKEREREGHRDCKRVRGMEGVKMSDSSVRQIFCDSIFFLLKLLVADIVC